ncbi:MAG TPA: glutamate racemase [Ruminococcaceae bacterium]|nr:glutamate racemase [Oscillospiraceae bacterium]
MSDLRPIGVFDSGLGGLTVAKEIIRLLPCEDIVYFGDTGRVPYGTKGPETIKRYAREDEKFLLSKGVKMIVAACGTVSSVAPDTAADLPVPFVEVISHSVKEAIEKTVSKKIGILATAATIKSGAHRRLILESLPDAEVTEVSGSLLVGLVEEGFTNKNDPLTIEAVRRYVQPFIDRKIDTLILGCTHFPLLADAVTSVLGEGVTLINMGTASAAAVKRMLTEKHMLNPTGGSHRFFVSDKGAEFQKTASVLLGEDINKENVETAVIDSI